MSTSNLSSGNVITRMLTRSPLIAVVLYLAIAGGLLVTAGLAIANILDHQRALAQTSCPLPRKKSRKVERTSEDVLGVMEGASI